MTITNNTKTSNGERDSDINESPLASALFRHIKEYYHISDEMIKDDVYFGSGEIREVKDAGSI